MYSLTCWSVAGRPGTSDLVLEVEGPILPAHATTRRRAIKAARRLGRTTAGLRPTSVRPNRPTYVSLTGQGSCRATVTFLGAYAIFFPMHYLGLLGVPRRYHTIGETSFVPASAADLNAFISVVALVVGAAQMLFLFNLFWSLRRGRESGPNPWRATTLEWQTPETPPGHGNWGKELPVVHRWAYDYAVPGAPEDFVPQNQPLPPPAHVAKGEATA